MTLDSHAIHTLIMDALGDEEFTSLCFYHFRPVHQRFAAEQNREARIRALVQHAENHREIPKLLKLIEKINPNVYREHIQQNLATLYEQGCGYMDGSEWQNALGKFEEIQETQFDYKETEVRIQRCQMEIRLAALYSQGRSYMRNGKWREALEMFEEILSIQPNYRLDPGTLAHQCRTEIRLNSLYSQGCSHIEKKRWEEALETFKEIQRIQPNYRDTETQLKRCHDQVTRKSRSPAPRSSSAVPRRRSSSSILATLHDICPPIAVVVVGWWVAWAIGKVSDPFNATPIDNLAGWIGGCVSGVSIAWAVPQILSNLRNPPLRFVLLVIAGAFVGALMWWLIYNVAPKSLYDSPVTYQAIGSACISILALLLLKFGSVRS